MRKLKMKIERYVFLCTFLVIGMLTVEGESFGNLIPHGKKILYKRKLGNSASACCAGQPSKESNGYRDDVWTRNNDASEQEKNYI